MGAFNANARYLYAMLHGTSREYSRIWQFFQTVSMKASIWINFQVTLNAGESQLHIDEEKWNLICFFIITNELLVMLIQFHWNCS